MKSRRRGGSRDDALEARCLAHVERVFALFERWTNELLRYAPSRLPESTSELRAAA